MSPFGGNPSLSLASPKKNKNSNGWTYASRPQPCHPLKKKKKSKGGKLDLSWPGSSRTREARYTAPDWHWPRFTARTPKPRSPGLGRSSAHPRCPASGPAGSCWEAAPSCGSKRKPKEAKIQIVLPVNIPLPTERD